MTEIQLSDSLKCLAQSYKPAGDSRANISQLHIPPFDPAVICTYKFLKTVSKDDTAYNLSTDRCVEVGLNWKFHTWS